MAPAARGKAWPAGDNYPTSVLITRLEPALLLCAAARTVRAVTRMILWVTAKPAPYARIIVINQSKE